VDSAWREQAGGMLRESVYRDQFWQAEFRQGSERRLRLAK
jgi:hypothetical protein